MTTSMPVTPEGRPVPQFPVVTPASVQEADERAEAESDFAYFLSDVIGNSVGASGDHILRVEKNRIYYVDVEGCSVWGIEIRRVVP